MSAVVSDSPPLICLCYLKREHLLQDLFGEVYIPPAVAAEVKRTHAAMGPIDAMSIAGLQIRAPLPSSLQLPATLDPGEREAIELAVELRADAVLMDELAGRRAAELLQLQVLGTCGVLRHAKAAGLIGAIRPLVDRLRSDLRFFISDALYEDVMRSVGEWP